MGWAGTSIWRLRKMTVCHGTVDCPGQAINFCASLRQVCATHHFSPVPVSLAIMLTVGTDVLEVLFFIKPGCRAGLNCFGAPCFFKPNTQMCFLDSSTVWHTVTGSTTSPQLVIRHEGWHYAMGLLLANVLNLTVPSLPSLYWAEYSRRNEK